MGKSRRRMTSPKFVKKFAAKYAKFIVALDEAATTVVETYEEIVEEVKEVVEEVKEVVEKTPKIIVKEIDKSAVVKPKPTLQFAKNSPRKNMPDSKKRPARKRKTSKKN